MYNSKGVKIVSLPTVDYDVYRRSNLKRLIRRVPREIHEGPSKQVAINFHNYKDRSNTKEKT